MEKTSAVNPHSQGDLKNSQLAVGHRTPGNALSPHIGHLVPESLEKRGIRPLRAELYLGQSGAGREWRLGGLGGGWGEGGLSWGGGCEGGHKGMGCRSQGQKG